MEQDIPPYRCPRCGSLTVERSSDSYYPPDAEDAHAAWKIVDFHCATCDLREEATNGDPAEEQRYGEMVRRWRNPEWLVRERTDGRVDLATIKPKPVE